MKRLETTTKLLLATTVAGLAILVAGTGVAFAAPAAQLQSTNTCWKDVVNDWLKNQPNLKGTYAIPCYTQAIQHLSQYPDVTGYSSAADDIHRALLAVIHNEGRGGGGGGTPANIGPTDPGPSSTGGGGPHKSFWTDITDRLAPGNAQSIPLPLIVLAGLALLLLLAAAATWFARRMQTRRVTPAPAPAPRR